MSTIFIANATDTPIQVVTTVSPDLKAEYWSALAPDAPPSIEPVALLRFNRAEGLTDGKSWVFTIRFTVDGVDIALEETVTGTLFASTMSQQITAGNQATGFVNTDNPKTICFRGNSGAEYSLGWSLRLSDDSPGHHDIVYKITPLSDTPDYVRIPAAMPQIETVVVLMLENRSLDNLLGMLYPGTAPASVYPAGSPVSFDGVELTAKNEYHDKSYSPSDGCKSMWSPSFDPHEDFPHIQSDLYANGKGELPAGNFWTTAPTMTGFAWDYNEVWTDNQEIMGSYNKAQLPVMYGLAESYAVSDRYFCSLPTQTYANRAYSMCGTSLGAVNNAEISQSTYAERNTVFNVLGDNGKSWGVYWVHSLASDLASGAKIDLSFEPFTPYYFPRLMNAPNPVGDRGLNPYNDDANPNAFLQAAKAGTLPNFCFVEPAWGGGFSADLTIQGTDFHPPASVGPADFELARLFNALVASPQWQNMLLIITFDENGGTFDHVPPPLTVAPDDIQPSAETAKHGFAFQRLGVRIPTILVSPYVPQGLVFRSPEEGKEFDHTSFIATMCKWAGVDPASTGLGKRVAQAPTFEGVVSLAAPRADAPVLKANKVVPRAGSIVGDLLAPAKADANGVVRKARAISFGDLHSTAHASISAADFVDRIAALRKPV